MSRSSALTVALLAWVLAGGAPGAHADNRCADGGGPRPDESGIGGTGLRAGGDDDGIGGTGLRAGDDDDGIGGTGISAADTGVIGTITGFASICVGGVEIHYDADSPVRIDGRAASAAELAVGQVVEVVASGRGDELTARRIGVTHLVAGPVTAVDAARNQIEVIGQTVRLSAATRGAGDGAAAASDFAPGAVVQVSGLRQADGAIAATRVATGRPELAWVSGTAADPTADTVAISGTPVRVSDGGALASGEEVRASGRWDGRQLIAERLDRLPALPFAGRVGRLEIEGFASIAAGDQLRVGCYVLEVPAGAAAEMLPAATGAERVRVEAVIDGGRAVVQRLDVAPPLPPRPQSIGDGSAARPPRQPPPDRGRPPAVGPGRDEPRPGPPDGARPEAVMRPDRPQRPARPDLPDRPPIERPPLPERPPVPERPPIPERPPRIERPFRPERPAP
ncbi:hypothetical protein KF840_18165 [bacterium]|nr:hypothetical protein [bacterium]